MRHLLSANLIQWTSVWYECLGLKGRVLKEHPLPSLLFSCPWILRLVLKIKLTNKSRELNYAACPSPDIILPRWKIQGSMLQTFRICTSLQLSSILSYFIISLLVLSGHRNPGHSAIGKGLLDSSSTLDMSKISGQS